MKESDDVASPLHESRQVGTFVSIAVRAGECQILQRVIDHMLLSVDMLDVKRQVVPKRLWKATIFAAIPCSLPDLQTGRSIHIYDALRIRRARA